MPPSTADTPHVIAACQAVGRRRKRDPVLTEPTTCNFFESIGNKGVSIGIFCYVKIRRRYNSLGKIYQGLAFGAGP